MAIPTQGTLLQLGDSAGTAPVFTTIYQVVNIRGPGGVANKIDTTHLLSLAKEYLPGLPDEGDLVFDINWDASQSTHQTLNTLRHTQPPEVRTWRIIYTDAGLAEDRFDGYVLGLEKNIQPDDRVLATVTLAITGVVTLTP